MTTSDLADRVRRELREQMERRRLTQQQVADMLQWTQARVTQKLTGRTPITLSELEGLCFAVGIGVVEAVRDRGLEFVADLTPLELRLVERVRQLDPITLDSVLHLLDVKKKTPAPDRYATKPKPYRLPPGRRTKIS